MNTSKTLVQRALDAHEAAQKRREEERLAQLQEWADRAVELTRKAARQVLDLDVSAESVDGERMDGKQSLKTTFVVPGEPALRFFCYVSKDHSGFLDVPKLHVQIGSEVFLVNDLDELGARLRAQLDQEGGSHPAHPTAAPEAACAD